MFVSLRQRKENTAGIGNFTQMTLQAPVKAMPLRPQISNQGHRNSKETASELLASRICTDARLSQPGGTDSHTFKSRWLLWIRHYRRIEATTRDGSVSRADPKTRGSSVFGDARNSRSMWLLRHVASKVGYALDIPSAWEKECEIYTGEGMSLVR